MVRRHSSLLHSKTLPSSLSGLHPSSTTSTPLAPRTSLLLSFTVKPTSLPTIHPFIPLTAALQWFAPNNTLVTICSLWRNPYCSLGLKATMVPRNL